MRHINYDKLPAWPRTRKKLHATDEIKQAKSGEWGLDLEKWNHISGSLFPHWSGIVTFSSSRSRLRWLLIQAKGHQPTNLQSLRQLKIETKHLNQQPQFSYDTPIPTLPDRWLKSEWRWHDISTGIRLMTLTRWAYHITSYFQSYVARLGSSLWNVVVVSPNKSSMCS